MRTVGDTPPAGLAHGNRTNKMFRPSLATVFNSFYGKIKKLTTRDTMIRLCLKHLYAVYSAIPKSEIFQAAERNLMQHFTASQLVVISAVLAHSWSNPLLGSKWYKKKFVGSGLYCL